MHPSEPLGWDLRSVVFQVEVRSIFDPTVPSIELRRIFEVFVTVLVLTNQPAGLHFIHSEIANFTPFVCYYCSDMHRSIPLILHKIKANDSNLPIQLVQTGPDATIVADIAEQFAQLVQSNVASHSVEIKSFNGEFLKGKSCDVQTYDVFRLRFGKSQQRQKERISWLTVTKWQLPSVKQIQHTHSKLLIFCSDGQCIHGKIF